MLGLANESTLSCRVYLSRRLVTMQQSYDSLTSRLHWLSAAWFKNLAISSIWTAPSFSKGNVLTFIASFEIQLKKTKSQTEFQLFNLSGAWCPNQPKCSEPYNHPRCYDIQGCRAVSDDVSEGGGGAGQLYARCWLSYSPDWLDATSSQRWVVYWQITDCSVLRHHNWSFLHWFCLSHSVQL